MRGLVRDTKNAVRAIARRPGASLAIAMTLALGLGINATVLGMADALLLRPFPFRDYDRLVVLWETLLGSSQRDTVAPANYLDWRAELASVASLAAWEQWDATLTGGDQPVRIQASRVSATFFDLLGVAPAVGRAFTPNEDRPGEHPRVVIGDGLWRRAFGADPSVVGKEVFLDGEPYTVIGVAPRRFAFPVGAELWAPLALTPERRLDRANRTLTVAGRLAAGRSLAHAQAELELIGQRLAREHPRTSRNRGATAQSLSVAFRDDIAVPFVGVLHAAAGLVLIAACANIAGLLLARAIDRRRELALRIALGASRAGIVRELLVETLVLGLLSSLAALAFTWVGLEVLRTSVPAETARFVEGWDTLRLDVRLGLLVPALAILLGLAVGLGPALSAARTPPMEALTEGGRGALGPGRKRGRQVLVTAEIALSLALLIAAGLTTAAGARLVNRPGGFDPEGLLRLQVVLPARAYELAGSRREFADALLARVEGRPAVQSAALANILPASGWSPATPFQVEQQEVADPARRPRAGYRSVSPGYFEAMRIPIARGRVFSAFDHEGGEPVAILSASLGERLWPGLDPVGRRLRLEDPETGWLSIVGVVGDVSMYNWWDGEDHLAIYRPVRQSPPGGALHVVVRPTGDPASALAAVREAVRSLDPLLPIEGVGTMRQAIADNSSGLTYLGGAMGLCGGIALLLSVVGISSVMAYAVRQRTREFGVRMALGATAGDVLAAAMRTAAAITACGLALGLLLAVALGQAMASTLAGAVHLDAFTFGAATLALAPVALGAAYLPARRVLRLDPAKVLRAE